MKIRSIGKMAMAAAFSATAFVAFSADTAPATQDSATQATAAAEEGTLSIEEARKRIAEAIEDPSVMEEVTKGLSAADQVTFLGEVNAAIARMPGSAEARAAAILNANNAALRSAKSGNLANMLAESFATATVDSLPILAERFAEDLFNRDADPSKKASDEQYVKIVGAAMETVNKRMAEVDAGGARSAFVAVMFIRASNTVSKDMVNAIGAFIPESSREDALNEWIPEALGLDGKEQSYDALVAVANGGVVPNITRTLEVAGPQFQGVLLSDLSGWTTDPITKMAERAPITDAIYNPFRLGRPIGGNNKQADGAGVPTSTEEQRKPVTPEPKPYVGQTLA